MATKLQFYSELSERSTKQLTKSRENWTEYLTTAARLYKYPFEEQVMIHAQRPNATACAPIETWNDPMSRRVKPGSKGIALIYEKGGETRLRYVFDYADTEGGWRGRNPIHPYIWEIKKEHEVPVMNALVKAYGDMEGTLADMLHNIAFELAEDYYNNNANDIAYSLKDSFLEDYDEDNVRVAFREAITVSTAYSLMSRCGIDPNEYFDDEDFNGIFDFNTQNTVTTLGMAVSELSEQILREIETTIKKYERNKTAERSTDYVSDNLNVQQERGLYASKSDAERTNGGTNREIRSNEAELHQEPPQDTLYVHASAREADTALGRNQSNSGTPLDTVDGGVDGAEPATGQGNRSDGMDSAHEQPESAGGGIYQQRTDLQLENQTKGAADETAPFSMAELAQFHSDWNGYLLNAIVREETVLNAAINSDRQNTITEIEAAVKRIQLAISQDILDVATITNKGQRINELDNYFTKERKPSLAEQLYNTVIRSEEYKERIAENTPKPIFISNDNDVHRMDLSAYRDRDIIGYNAKGVEFSLMRMGEHTFITTTTQITTWGEILGAGKIPADIIKQIRVANGHETETATPPEQEMAEIGDIPLSGQLDEQAQSENTPEQQEYKYYSVSRPVDIGTYPRVVSPSKIVNFDSRESVEDGAFEAWGYLVYSQPLTDEQIQNYELRAALGNSNLQVEKNGSQIGVNLSDSQEIASLSEIIEQSGISLDTVDTMLRDGGNKNNSIMRIAAHYMKDKTPVENAEFIAREYGSGGKGLRIDNQRYTSWFDEKGITIAEEPTALNAMRSVHLSWEHVENRVHELLYSGQYMPQTRLDKVESFERKELADKIWYLHQDTENDYEFFIDRDIFGGFPDSTERIAGLLSQPEQLDSIIDGLRVYCTVYEQDPSILNYKRLHNPQELLQRLSDLRISPVAFTANEIPSKSCVPFVTEDDIENVLTRGSNVSQSKFRIYSYFLHEHTSKEKADFLKNEYGTGGSSHAIFRADNSNENHDSKGIEISRGSIMEPHDKVLIPWSRAARLIDELINTGNFMTRDAIERIPDYERQMLGARIINFYRDLPEDIPRPVLIDNSRLGDYWGNARAIGNMLDNPDTVSEILTAMRPIWEVTPPEDKYYKVRQEVYADLTAYRDGTFTLFPQLSAVAMPEDNITVAPQRATLLEAPRGKSEQLTLFSLPTLEEQQAVLSKVEEKRHNATQQSSAFSMPVIEQSDIDTAICRWNNNIDSKITVYEYMYENARARETANLLKDEYGGDLSAFTVEKDGAESVNLPWPKVQKRIAQLMDDGQFLSPEEQEYANNKLQKVWDNLVAENAKSELSSQPVMVIDNIARNNYNLFALAFPQIVNGSYRSMTFKNEENKHELSISHDTTNAGLIHFDISYYKPDGTAIYDPMITLEVNFENRMLKPIQYANTLSGEDIGLLSIPSPNDALRLEALGVGIHELLAGIKNQGFTLSQTEVFNDVEGKPLPASQKKV